MEKLIPAKTLSSSSSGKSYTDMHKTEVWRCIHTYTWSWHVCKWPPSVEFLESISEMSPCRHFRDVVSYTALHSVIQEWRVWLSHLQQFSRLHFNNEESSTWRWPWNNLQNSTIRYKKVSLCCVWWCLLGNKTYFVMLFWFCTGFPREQSFLSKPLFSSRAENSNCLPPSSNQGLTKASKE